VYTRREAAEESPHSGDELVIYEFYTRLLQGYPTVLYATESTLQALAERT
jgi:hypothetical protein